MPKNNTISRMKFNKDVPEWACLISKGHMYDVKLELTPKGYAATQVKKCDGLCIKEDLPFRVVGVIKAEIRLLISIYENKTIKVIVHGTPRIDEDFFKNIPTPKEAKK